MQGWGEAGESGKRVLVVDDDDFGRGALSEVIRSFGHEVEEARDGIEALAMLKLDIDLVLLDVQMPGMDGFQVARRVRQDPDGAAVPIIMVTGLAAREDRLRAVEAGANDFIAKPADMTELRVRTTSLLRMKDAQDALKRHQAMLEETVRKRTDALRQALAEMGEAQRKTHAAYVDTVRRLAIAAEFKDRGTAAHIGRIGSTCAILARALNLPPSDVETLRMAAPMHDVGKIGVPDGVLLKPGSLSDAEWDVVRQHTVMGYRMLQGSPSQLLEAGAVIALSHHERWDGSGYPGRLAGEDIPLWGRICAVADVFDALASERPYKPAYPTEKAVAMLRKVSGSHLDPRIVDAFLSNATEIADLHGEDAGRASNADFLDHHLT